MMGTVISPGPWMIHASVGVGDGRGVKVAMEVKVGRMVAVTVGGRGVVEGAGKGVGGREASPLHEANRNSIPKSDIKNLFIQFL
jgi:hypothetical protein